MNNAIDLLKGFTAKDMMDTFSSEKLMDLSNCILGWNIPSHMNKFKNLAKSYYDEIFTYYCETNNIAEDVDPNMNDVLNWLMKITNDYASKTSVKYPAVIREYVFYSDAEDIILDVISELVSEFSNKFEKDISTDAVITYAESSNVGLKFKDMLSCLFSQKNERYPCPTLNTIYDFIYWEYCGFYILDPKENEKFSSTPLAMEFEGHNYTDTNIFNTLKHAYFDNPTEICNFLDKDVNRKNLIKEACAAFYYMYTNNLRNNTLFDKLVKCIVLYYGILEVNIQSQLKVLQFLNEYLDKCFEDKHDEPYEIINNTKVVSPSCYPEDFAKILYEIIATRGSKSTEAAIDSGYDFGRRQLNSDKLSYGNFAINNIDGKYKSKFLKIKNIWNEIRNVKPNKFKSKINSVYFKKWYGRIPSMFARYGNEATVTENRMKGDPTLILANSAPKYITNIVTETNKVFQGLIDLSKRVASTSEINSKVGVVKSFCSTYKIEDPKDPKEIERAIKNEAMYRIAKSILQENGVYGYSVEGIVENGKFPTANHIVTSLFIDNSHEEPEEIPVNNIFSKPESITVFAHPQRLATFDELYKKIMTSITQNFNHKMISSVHQSMELNYKNYANSLRRKSGDVEGGDADEASLNKKLAKAIENGVVDALDMAIDQKVRCLQVVGAMYDMVTRVQKLAKLCVASLHAVETKHGDNRMNAGINDKLRNASNARLNYVNKENNSGRYIQQHAKKYL